MSKLHVNICLEPYHTFRIKEQTAGFFEFNKPSELKEFLLSSDSRKFSRLLPIGTGSNLLFTKKFDGCILHSTDSSIEIIENKDEYVLIKTGAGIEWDDFVQWAVNKNYYGIENLSLIPGTTGATPIQNIGAYGVEVKDYIECCTGMDLKSGEEHIFKNKDIKFGYRDSVFKNELRNKYFITSVTFKLYKSKELNLNYGSVKEEVAKIGNPTLETVRKAIINIRESKLPDHKILGNAGSFFKNPIINKDKANLLRNEYPQIPYYDAADGMVKIAAGWLIDQCGLKGFEMDNGAAVHEHQALVIINKGVNSGKDIKILSEHIKKEVLEKFNIELDPEVKIL